MNNHEKKYIADCLKKKSELLLKIAEKLPVANIILIKTYINNLISNYYKPELI